MCRTRSAAEKKNFKNYEFGGTKKEYKKGDICPLCGEPIVTNDVAALQLLGMIAEELGLDKESEEETHGEEKS